MCYSGRCPHEDRMGNCTWEAPGNVWPEECSANQPHIITDEDEVISDMLAQMRAYTNALITSLYVPSEFLRPATTTHSVPALPTLSDGEE